MAAGVGPGDEVVLPAHTFIATALGVLHAGATPVLCDVAQDTRLIDPVAAAAAVGPRTAAIIGVHLYGQPCAMVELRTVAERHGLLLLEDGRSSAWRGALRRRAGALGDAAAFSFYPSKNLGALGDGGAVTTTDPALAERVMRLRNLGQRRKGVYEEIGHNARLDGLQAACLRVKLSHLDEANAARRAHARAYDEALSAPIASLPAVPGTVCVYHLYPVRTPQRDGAARYLRDQGVQTGVHYSPAIHQHAAMQKVLDDRLAAYPNAEAWATQELSLPMFAELHPVEVARVAQNCAAWAATL